MRHRERLGRLAPMQRSSHPEGGHTYRRPDRLALLPQLSLKMQRARALLPLCACAILWGVPLADGCSTTVVGRLASATGAVMASLAMWAVLSQSADALSEVML